MAHQPIEDLLPKAGGSIYALARLAANRAIELAEGKPQLIQKVISDKETTVALEEILQGKVVTKGPLSQASGKSNKN